MRSVLDLLKFRFKKLSYGWEKKMVLRSGLRFFVDVPFVRFTYVLRRHVYSTLWPFIRIFRFCSPMFRAVFAFVPWTIPDPSSFDHQETERRSVIRKRNICDYLNSWSIRTKFGTTQTCWLYFEIENFFVVLAYVWHCLLYTSDAADE